MSSSLRERVQISAGNIESMEKTGIQGTSLYRRFLGFSIREWVLIMMGLVALVYLKISFPLTWWKIAVSGIGLGFLFEAGMASLFTYHRSLSDRHCVQGSDVNFLFSLGWLEVTASIILVAEVIIGKGTIPVYIMTGIVIGSFHEFLS